jgi:hypothetical protein
MHVGVLSRARAQTILPRSGVEVEPAARSRQAERPERSRARGTAAKLPASFDPWRSRPVFLKRGCVPEFRPIRAARVTSLEERLRHWTDDGLLATGARRSTTRSALARMRSQTTVAPAALRWNPSRSRSAVPSTT